MAIMATSKVLAAAPLDALEALLRFQDAYADDAKALVEYLRSKGLGFTLKGLSSYYSDLERRFKAGEIKAATLNKRITGAKKRVRQLLAQGNPSLSAAERYRIEEALSALKTVKTRDPAVDKERLPSDEEVGRLASLSRDPLVRVIVPFLAETGLRISEALSIRLTDIAEARGCFRITVRGKGNKEREILVAQWLVKRIRSAFDAGVFLFEHHGKPYSRIATTDRIKAESRAVLGRSLSAHAFRHYFATRLLAQGKSLKAVSRFLGHASTQITADIYQHDSLQWEDLEDTQREGLYDGPVK